MANGLYDGSLESIPGLGGYLQQQRLTNQQDLGTLQKAQAIGGIVQQQQSLADAQKVRAALTSGGDPGTVIQSLIQAGPTGIDAAKSYMGVRQMQSSLDAMKGLNLSDPAAVRQFATAKILGGDTAGGGALMTYADHMDARQANVAGLANDQSQTAPVTPTPAFGLGAPGTQAAGVPAYRANIPIADPGTGGIPPAVQAALAQLKPGQPFSVQTAATVPGNTPFTDPNQKVGGAYAPQEQSADPVIAAEAVQRQNRLNAIPPTSAGTYNPAATGTSISQLQTQENNNQQANRKTEVTIRGQDLGLQGREMMVNGANLRAGIGADGQLTPEAQAEAQAIAEGKISPQGHSPQIVGAALAINPGLSQGQFAAGTVTEKAMPALTQPFNAATLHLAQLGQLAEALKNNDTQLINGIGNKIAMWNGGAAPTNFDALKQIVGQEVTKAIVANGGSAGERDEASKTIASYSSPAQFAGVIQTYQNAMGAQLQALAQRYKSGGGQKDFSSFLLPEAQAAFQRESQGAAQTNQAGPITAPAPAIAMLKAHPDFARQFDAKYGAGSAARVLGQ